MWSEVLNSALLLHYNFLLNLILQSTGSLPNKEKGREESGETKAEEEDAKAKRSSMKNSSHTLEIKEKLPLKIFYTFYKRENKECRNNSQSVYIYIYIYIYISRI